MASRINIKEVIETLCQLLYRHGYPKIPAEVLRQAKFDKTEAAQPLLNLLFQILTFEKSTNVRFKDWDERKKYLFVLSVLKNLDYPKLLFMVSIEMLPSSRELLLTCGFVIAKLDIMADLRYRAEHLVTKEFLKACKQQSNHGLVPESCHGNLDHVIRVNKMIDLNHRALLSASSYLDKLLSKFSLFDDKVIIGELYGADHCHKRSATILDLIFFDNARLQQQMLRLLHEQVELLKLHNKWLQHEHLFWKWLSSIQKELVLQQQQTAQTKSTSILESTKSEDAKSVLPQHFLLCKRSVLDELSKDYVVQTKETRDLFLVRSMEQLLKTEILFQEEEKPKVSLLKNEKEEEIKMQKKTELESLKNWIVELEDRNKECLSGYLDANHPDLVHFPELKKD